MATADREPGTLNTLDVDTPAYYRCASCCYVLGPQTQPPGWCPSCSTRGGVFTPTEIVYPERPSDAAVARDTRPTEAAIRTAYQRLARHDGDMVPLTEIRAALAADWDRETVDAALSKLAGHSDVHLSPRTDQKQADPATQRAALHFGGGYSHTLTIDPQHSVSATLQHIRSTNRVQADSILAPLTDADVTYLAE